MRIVNMGDWPLSQEDEQAHKPGGEPLWNESHYFDFVSEDGELGGYVRLGLYPNWKRAWYWACLVTGDGRRAEVIDHEAPLPGPGLVVAGDGYTASCHTPEPFGSARVRLSSAGLSLDLEWRTSGGVYGYALTPRYEVPCEVNGTIEGLGFRGAFHGHGERDHSWGVRDWWSISWLWSSGRLADGTQLHGMQANLGVALPWPAFRVPPGGELEHVADFSAATEFDGDRPVETVLRFPGLATRVRPLAFAPVTLTSAEGAVAEFPRAMCRFEAEDGRTGYGWTEWHQPPGWQEHGWRPPT
ncbi:DUF7065 domain-containing protein [Nonomuraea jiangxiensis]|uniref:Tocopherol cyclase n=1 Tax=Nonomuraea jiangxiensis TaxID=633440 RepID=A0A1G8NQH7_9ACTN|nr:hypothetical protein [Nonomuraea jiangxiensis]SDI82387.1 hypothetical protein SAMN05421869_107192 [Nonomuraea jiangxiensis]